MARTGGFSLIELLVALTVLALLLGLSAPMASALGDTLRVTGLANELLAQLHLARSEAIKRNGSVVVCSSADGERCAEAGGWDQGWIMFHDANHDGLREPGEPVMHRVGAAPAGFRLVGNGTVARNVGFASTGATRTATGAFQAGTLTVCRQSAQAGEARQIVISAVGRPRIRSVQLPACE